MSGFTKFLGGDLTVPKSKKSKKTKKKKNLFVAHLVPDNFSIEEKKEETKKTVDASEFNIFHIDSQIKDSIRKKTAIIPSLEQKISDLDWIANKSKTSSISERIKARKMIFDLRSEILNIEKGYELSLYLLSSQSILAEYKKLQQDNGNTSFVKVKTQNNPNVSKCSELKLRFLCIAKRYIPIENFRQLTKKLSCSTCGSFEFTQLENNVFSCVCGAVTELMDDTPNFKDTERINMGVRYVYTRKAHFIDAMDQFEGKQNTNISPEVYQLLRKQMELHKLTKETVTKDEIYMFLFENSLSQHYEDINLIYFVITGKAPPNISKLRARLIERNDRIEEVYPLAKDPDRINSLNVNFKLYKLLQLEGFPCKKDDFYILKTKTKIEEHQKVWYDMCDLLGWPKLDTI